MVVDLAEFLRVQPELAGHLHVGCRQPVPALRVGPRLPLVRSGLLLRHVRPLRSGPRPGQPWISRPCWAGRREVAPTGSVPPWMRLLYQPRTMRARSPLRGLRLPRRMALIAFSTIRWEPQTRICGVLPTDRGPGYGPAGLPKQWARGRLGDPRGGQLWGEFGGIRRGRS